MPTGYTYEFTSTINIGDFIMIPPKKDSSQIVTYYIGVNAPTQSIISV